MHVHLQVPAAAAGCLEFSAIDVDASHLRTIFALQSSIAAIGVSSRETLSSTHAGSALPNSPMPSPTQALSQAAVDAMGDMRLPRPIHLAAHPGRG